MKANPFTWFLIGGFAALFLLIQTGVVASDFDLHHENLIYAEPSFEYPLGNDVFGRNILSRALRGFNTALLIGFFSSLFATAIGTFMGSLAGYKEGIWARWIEWVYTTLDSVPYLLLLAAFSYSLGAGLKNTYIALGLTAWVPLCRMLQVEVQRLKKSEFVQSARALGFSHVQIISKHILPNTFGLILTQFSLTFVMAIKIEVLLSYMGLGVEIGVPSWGLMIDDAKSEWARGFWWNLIAATGFMFILVFSLTWMIEKWRIRLDPHSIK